MVHMVRSHFSLLGCSLARTNCREITIDMCYLLVHVEESKGKQRVSWPIRQTAVFHRFVPNSEGSLWIFINPMPNSVLQQRLERTVVHGELLSCSRDLQHLHLLVLSSYIENWRWYLKALNEEFTEIVSQT
jgi:hypothetical protein